MEAVGCTGLPAHRCRRRRFPSHVERDWTQPYVASDAVEQAWLAVYRAPETHCELYQLGEELTDLEDAFRLWRFRHVTTVERVICFKRGTRHQRRGLPAQDARRGAVPGNLEAAHRFVAAPSASQLGAGLLFPSCCLAAIGNRRRKNLWWRAFGLEPELAAVALHQVAHGSAGARPWCWERLAYPSQQPHRRVGDHRQRRCVAVMALTRSNDGGA